MAYRLPPLTALSPTQKFSPRSGSRTCLDFEQLPEARQPTRNMADMKMLLNSLYPHAEVSLHLTIARWRFIPSARPLGARDL